MNAITLLPSEPQEAQTVSDLYQRAAQELLQAYQRNKEATRHHARGAFRAALHHARLSCLHSSAAHACLMQAQEKADRLSSVSGGRSLPSHCMPLRTDH